jgi:Tfp pilus assembly protein PilN
MKLVLDFAAARRLGLPGLCVLSGGLVLGIAGMWHRQTLLDEWQLLKTEHEHTAQLRLRAANPVRTASPGKADTQLARINASFQLPWERMLDSLQRDTPAGVMLLVVKPRSSPLELGITGRAGSAGEVLEFARRLTESGSWRNVTLLREGSSAQSGGPVEFQLSATWHASR